MAFAVPTSLIQLLDNSGDVLNGGSVTVYQDGTTNLISLFSDDGLSIAADNPITLDSAGRHDCRYFAAENFKLVVKNSGGTTLWTRDDIDPAVPLGSGVLAIANGGTGASSAATALSNLGGVSAADIADLEADVAALVGAGSSTEKTHLATGTTAQRPASPADGDVRRNTTDAVYEGYNGSAWVNFVVQPTGVTDPSATDTQEGLIELATAAEITTGTDVARAVTPGRQHAHSSAAKFWVKANAAGAMSVSYNMTSVTDTGTGVITLTIATDFSTANWACVATVENLDATIDSETDVRVAMIAVSSQAAGSVQVLCAPGGTLSGPDDPTTWHIVGFGAQ